MLGPGPKLPSYMRYALVPHAQKVCQLYKKAIYDLRMKHRGLFDYRYNAMLMRQRFEANRHIVDEAEARRLLDEGWKEYWATKAAQDFVYATSPGAACYERVYHVPDQVLDMWHPDEKAMYPDYFAKRDQRKKEFMERWAKKYGYASAQEAEAAHPVH